MAYCAVCGKHDGLNNKCNYCGQKHCKEHQLPENHRCSGLLSNGWKNYRQARENRGAIPRTTIESPSKDEPQPENSDAGKTPTSSGDKSPSVGLNDSVTDPIDPPVEPQEEQPADPLEKHLPASLYSFFYRFGELLTHAMVLSLGLVILTLGFLFSTRGVYALLTLAMVIGAYSAVVGTGVEPVDDTVDSVIIAGQEFVIDVQEEARENDPGQSGGSSGVASTSQSGSSDDGSGVQDGESSSVDAAEIERAIHEEVNDRRQARGRSALAYDDRLAEVANYHSERMLREGFFAHTGPDGETMADRYDRFNYDCRVSTGGNSYAGGAENIAYTYAGSDVMSDSGDVINHRYNETSIGNGLVNQWMNSTGHRENILRNYWQNEGIGVAVGKVDGDVRVYATQNFC